ncbi:MAG: FecCD family ABC transporter permease [Trueperaceae bacterium]
MNSVSSPVSPATLQRRFPSLFWSLTFGLSVGLVIAIILSVSVGAVALPFEKIIRIILHNTLGLTLGEWKAVEEQIVWEFRLPRVLLAAIVGSALSVAGTVLQAMVRNPVADPYVLGISSGASIAAVAVITLGAGALGGLSVSAAAFLGSLSTMVLVYLLSQQRGRVTPTRLILAGVAISYILQAFTSFLILRAADPGNGAVASVLYWLAGSLGGAKWQFLGIPALVLFIACVWLLARARPLNALLAGDESAIGLGINLERFRQELFVVTSLLVGVAVAISGAIGFVGLMIPHIVRFIVGSDHRRVLPVVALLGAVYLVLADLLSRIIIAPSELPVGIVTAALGGPFFLWLLRRQVK